MATRKRTTKIKPTRKKMPIAIARARLSTLATQVLDELEGKPECRPTWTGGPGADVMDPANWTCVVTGGAKCSDGNECKFLFKEGTKPDGTKYKFPSCCKD